MKSLLPIVVALVLATGCASSTVLRSYPAGATVKSPSGAILGMTPYSYSDTEMNGHSQTFVIEKEGYEPVAVTVRRDQWNGGRTAISVGAGVFFFWPLFGLLWAQDYQPEYGVQLQEKALPPPPVAKLEESEWESPSFVLQVQPVKTKKNRR
ncbi:MAG: hypothetical protein ACJ790_10295 [Myxococcaceae bacterium]